MRQEAESDADVSVTTDLRTLIALLRYAIVPEVALGEERVTLHVDADAFRRFVELFAWQPEEEAPTAGSAT